MCADVLVIGGGITGLMAAQALQRAKLVPQVVEKEAKVGGRLATWGAKADYGTQYFSCGSKTFKSFVDKWLSDKMVRELNYDGYRGSLFATTATKSPIYYATGGMAHLMQYLAKSVFRLHVGTTIDLLFRKTDHWIARDTLGRDYEAKMVLLTQPVPLALELLERSHIEIPSTHFDRLDRVHYRKCLTAIFEMEDKPELMDGATAFQNPYDDIAWIIDNQAKGLSGQGHSLTVQCDWVYSNKHWNEADDVILSDIQENLKSHLKSGTIQSAHLKRWDHAITATTYPFDYLVAFETPPLAFAGDAFGGRGGVEGAVLSGIAVAERLAEIANNQITST